MDNREFTINGKTKEQLKLALDLLLLGEYGEEKVVGWYINPEKGFILTTWKSSEDNYLNFTDNMGRAKPISKEDLLEVLWDWKNSDEAKNIPLSHWEEDLDHDGSNDIGWKLYTEEWGHVRGKHSLDHSSIIAFKRIYCWYGK